MICVALKAFRWPFNNSHAVSFILVWSSLVRWSHFDHSLLSTITLNYFNGETSSRFELSFSCSFALTDLIALCYMCDGDKDTACIWFADLNVCCVHYVLNFVAGYFSADFSFVGYSFDDQYCWLPVATLVM